MNYYKLRKAIKMGNNKKRGFTLAEVLATLAVISAIAAFIIPSVVANYREVSDKTQKKTFVVSFYNAIRNIAAVEGGVHKGVDTDDFVKKYLVKSLKLSKICEQDMADDCGWITMGDAYSVPTKDNYIARAIPLKVEQLHSFGEALTDEEILALYDTDKDGKVDQTDINNMLNLASNIQQAIAGYTDILVETMDVNGDGEVSILDATEMQRRARDARNIKGQMVAATTLNGVSLLIAHNNQCKGALINPVGQALPAPCVNVIYDINGKSAPNTVGEDVGFLTIFGATNPKIGAPIFYNDAPYNYDLDSLADAREYCNKFNENGELDVPNIYEAGAIYINPFDDIPSAGELIRTDSSGGNVALCVYK